MSGGSSISVDDIEIQLLLDGLVQYTGYNFQEYDPALLRRRIEVSMATENVATVSGLQEKALHDAGCLERLLITLTQPRTGMFLDPVSFKTVRSLVVPLLRTYPFLRVWQVGCSSGEETYSIAMLLAEEGLYQRCKIYATDCLESSVNTARAGSYASAVLTKWAANYGAAGGTRSLSDYLRPQGADMVVVDPMLRRNIVFARHDVVSDASFNEFHLIMCSHVLNQFNMTLQSRVHRLLYSSLIRLGFLALGSGESMQYCPYEQYYRTIDDTGSVYRRMR